MTTGRTDAVHQLPVAHPAVLLPGPPETERADAARNRQLLVCAARTIIAEQGIGALSMDALARAAGVGKGTIFRRFGSRAGLLQYLMNETEIEFQRSFLDGPPPLGPGAPAVERLVAFGRARLDIFELQGELLVAIDRAATVQAMPPRIASVSHIAMLLREARVDADVPVLASSLQAVLDSALARSVAGDGGLSLHRFADGWEDLIRRVVAAG